MSASKLDLDPRVGDETVDPMDAPESRSGSSGVEQTARVAVLLVSLTFLGGLAAVMLPHRTSYAHLPSVASLDGMAIHRLNIPFLVAAATLVLIAVARHRGLRSSRASIGALALLLASAAGAFVSGVGNHVVIAAVALVLAIAVGGHAEGGVAAAAKRWHRHVWWMLWGAVGAVHATFSLHRHWAFGSGSWDHGCMVHNFYRASRFLETTSTVLGDVDFLGDHFMVGIYLYAPILWIDSSGYTVLLIQALNVAAAAPAVYLIARHRGASLTSALVLGVCTGLSFGLQSASFFDSHEITVGIGFLAFGLWALETGRLRLATVLLVLFATFKESLGAYVVALGLLLCWRALRDRNLRFLRFGAAWIAFGAVWFVLVNRVFMPTLIARANKPEPHETFGDFGRTIFDAAIGIVTHPLKAFLAVFVPAEKLASHAVLFGGLGWLPLFAPEILIAALPLFAERFLSSKGTMWEMGYHYAAPLSLYAGWAVAMAWPRIVAAFERGMAAIGLAGRGAAIATAYVLTCAILVTSVGYRHPANFYKWNEGYFSKPARRDANCAAVAVISAAGTDARVAAQNRILPHLADRPVIYRLGDWEKTDWVVLSVGESAWPWDDGLPLRVARRLAADPGWRLVFAQESTGVFARTTATDRPAVAPTPGLQLPARDAP